LYNDAHPILHCERPPPTEVGEGYTNLNFATHKKCDLRLTELKEHPSTGNKIVKLFPTRIFWMGPSFKFNHFGWNITIQICLLVMKRFYWYWFG